jgi:hypothetical protein
MAKGSGMGDLLKYGLLAVGGYLLYSNFVSQPAVSAPAASTGGGAPPTPPPTTPAAAAAASSSTAATVAALKTWAAGDPNYKGTYTSDQWHWGWINILKKPGIPDADFMALFPGGTPPMTAEAFVAAAVSRGLSGLGRPRVVRMPGVLPAPAAAAVALAMQRRHAGINNYQLRGTPMPKGMR